MIVLQHRTHYTERCIEVRPLSVRQIGIWRGCPRGQCVPGAVHFVTALTRSVSLLQSS